MSVMTLGSLGYFSDAKEISAELIICSETCLGYQSDYQRPLQESMLGKASSVWVKKE